MEATGISAQWDKRCEALEDIVSILDDNSHQELTEKGLVEHHTADSRCIPKRIRCGYGCASAHQSPTRPRAAKA